MPFCCLKLGRRKRGPDGSSGRASKGAGTKATPLLQHEATNGGGASSRVQSGGVKKGQGATDAEDVLSQTEYHDCQEDFSVAGDRDGSAAISPMASNSGSPTHSHAKLAPSFDHGSSAATNGAAASNGQLPGSGPDSGAVRREGSFISTDMPAGASESSDEPGGPGGTPPGPLLGCLTILGTIRHAAGTSAPAEGPDDAHARSSTRAKSGRRSIAGKPDAGASLKFRDPSFPVSDAREMYEDGDGTTFQVRSLDYMRTKVKVPSEKCIYHLVAADMFTFEKRQLHIAKLVNLPPAPAVKHLLGGDAFYPPLLIFNLQLPLYPASIFGTNDGVGQSIVYYFALSEDFDPATFQNQKALGLFRRFVQNGREEDGQMTRDRLKLIPRIANPEEWAARGPLSSSEYKLLVNYNDKPILTRPQHHFFHGRNYLEVDLDIHNYAFLARKALGAFILRLKEVVFENAFVIQGNSIDELPEMVLGVSRMFRAQLDHHRPFSNFVPPTRRPSLDVPARAAAGSGQGAGQEGQAAGAGAGGGGGQQGEGVGEGMERGGEEGGEGAGDGGEGGEVGRAVGGAAG